MVFGDGQSNGVIQFYPGPSLVATATKFGTKWAKLSLCKRYLRDFCVYAGEGGFQEWVIECCQSNFTPSDSHCNGNKIWDKM